MGKEGGLLLGHMVEVCVAFRSVVDETLSSEITLLWPVVLNSRVAQGEC